MNNFIPGLRGHQLNAFEQCGTNTQLSAFNTPVQTQTRIEVNARLPRKVALPHLKIQYDDDIADT
jgi:hypothetical protein